MDLQPAANNDVEQNKIYAVLAYLIFFLPLIAAKESRFAMYHANQGLLLLILAVGVNVIGSVIPILGWLIILPLGNLFVFVLAILGIINAAQGKQKELPIIGKYVLLK